MLRIAQWIVCVLLLTSSCLAQQKRLWILRPSGEIVEYDLTAFAAKQTVKVPPAAAKTPASVSVNRLGQILFASSVSLPLTDEDVASPHKIWFWDGHTATTLDAGIDHKAETVGSNQAVMESAPTVYLSADGNHLFWFANQQRRLQREGVDLSVTTTLQAWQTDTSGGNRQDLATMKLPECRCTTGSCEESCPAGVVWVPPEGFDKFFLVMQIITGQTQTTYKATTLYQESAGKWSTISLAEPLHRVLDTASDGDVIVDAIPDAGCCGWSNQSNDQTLLHFSGKTLTVFDERATYKNPDYDVSFYTSDAKLSPDRGYIAMTVTASAGANQPIQVSEDGEANPEESKQIRRALTELPAVEVEKMEETPRRVDFVPHAVLVGWIGEKELLIVEDHFLVFYNVATGARRKSSVKVEDTARVFLR